MEPHFAARNTDEGFVDGGDHSLHEMLEIIERPLTEGDMALEGQVGRIDLKIKAWRTGGSAPVALAGCRRASSRSARLFLASSQSSGKSAERLKRGHKSLVKTVSTRRAVKSSPSLAKGQCALCDAA
jgi:hypothetical protein